MRKVKLGIVAGTGVKALLKNVEKIRVGTPYGLSPISMGDVGGRPIAFLPRHGFNHSIPPHKVNYRANIYALYAIGVERIVAINAVGAINLDFKPGDLVVPHDLIDLTKQRQLTFYNEAPVTHIDVSQPYCPDIRRLLIKIMKKHVNRAWQKAVYVCTEGPRYETPAEIRMLRLLGCDIVGMTMVPEAVLARELEICYASICFVSNMAAGIEQRLTAHEVMEMGKEKTPVLQQILTETIRCLPLERQCPCAHSLDDARG